MSRGPFVTITIDYFNALFHVYRRANDLMRIVSEFPKDPSCWGEHIDALDNAIDKTRKYVE